MKKSGFTLIEIIVIVGILGFIAVIGSNMFFSILKGSTKTRVLAEVKQNGSYAINVMERLIRNAKSLENWDGGGEWIEIRDPDDYPTIFSCEDSDGDGFYDIASNSASLTSDKVEVVDCASVFNVVEGEAGIRPDAVTINFTLKQAGTVARPEEEASVNFKTTVTLRNY